MRVGLPKLALTTNSPKNRGKNKKTKKAQVRKNGYRKSKVGTQSGELIVGMVVLIGIAAFSLIQWMTQVHELRQDRIAPPGVHQVVKR